MKLKTAYSEAVRLWDKKIRLVGKIPVEQLYKESLEALRGGGIQAQCLVDIGAGNGILGVPWLELSPLNKCIFIEPDAKKAAFLLDFISKADPAFNLKTRAQVVCSKFENVPRETLSSYSANSYCLATRAFSGALSLVEAKERSPYKNEEIFVFDLVNGHACFKKLV